MAEIGAPPDTVRLLGDTWYRDEVKPHARIKKKPKSGSTFSVFNFDADKPGAYVRGAICQSSPFCWELWV